MRSSLFTLVAIAVAMSPAVRRGEDELGTMLDSIRTRHDLPALAAAVVKDGRIVASGIAGVRVYHASIPALIDDRFHVGSDTKAMTATLIGMLVEQGKLRWNSSIGEVLGPVVPGLKPRFAAITLEQLLSHTSGLPSDNDELVALYTSPEAYDYTLTEYRRRIIATWGAKHEPRGTEKVQFEYSNFGYIIAGAMIEQAADEPWEHLITTRIFEPLGLKSAGLGPQATLGKWDAPVGHAVDGAGRITPRPWGPSADVPLPMGPAGIAHMSVRDFAVWAGWNAGEGKRGPVIVSSETLKRLHRSHVTMEIADPKPGTPKSGAYALGWGLAKFDWTPKPVLTHNGSNSMNFALILVDAEIDLAITTMTNFPGQTADRAAVETAEQLYRRYAKSVARN